MTATWQQTDLTVAEHLRQWIEQRISLRDSTRASYRGHIERYLVPHLGSTKLSALGPAQIATMYDRIRTDASLTTTTLRRIHATLTSALSNAVQQGLITLNPASLVELPRTRPVERPTWTSEELARFLREARSDPLYTLFLLLGLAGLRRGEAVALQRGDVDLDSSVIRICRSSTKVGNRILVGELKTHGSRRSIAIDQRTCAALRDYIDLQGDRCRDPGSFLYAAGDGTVDPAWVSRRFDALVARADLPRIRLHDLRHTSASVGIEAGESLVEVSRRLGHSSITVTADVYSHIAPKVSHRSARRLADLVYIQHNEGDA